MIDFKLLATWFADKNTDIVEIKGESYALNGWNGESYTDCWTCEGILFMNASDETHTITPIYDDDEIMNYEIYQNI